MRGSIGSIGRRIGKMACTIGNISELIGIRTQFNDVKEFNRRRITTHFHSEYAIFCTKKQQKGTNPFAAIWINALQLARPE